MEVRHLKVPKSSANSVMASARRHGQRLMDFSVFSEGDFVYIPVKDDAQIEGIESVRTKGKQRESLARPQKVSGSFDAIGSIAIIKTKDRDSALRLAKSILEDNRGIRSVYMDTGISGEYRLRNLLLVSGEENRRAIHRENGVEMIVDLETVYFSPRLATERLLLSKKVKDGEKILDMFCGVGPFSLTIAKYHSCEVSAIDKNPTAIQLLNENIKHNRLIGTIHPILGDAAAVVPGMKGFDRILMNLPESSGDYLQLASSALKEGGLINYYENMKVENLEERMESMREEGFDLVSKRQVHSLSKTEFMFSLELKKRTGKIN
ncbi:MAG: class I SAM-dependent methyltransferase family protein [Candidatus Thermoplasmatota archaeon]|nr:class I SAM-dependent methyltransferase family protein [Candidatus Thermoplasmatota archaeon]MCL5785891.1 class I SAM-dependent methyltransferase family protein [Candidatus Thermoplasmatota archaeon]